MRLRETLARAAAEDWESTVGAWRGITLAPGAMRRKEVAGSVPLVPGVPVRLSVEYGLEAMVPCGEEETERRCVLDCRVREIVERSEDDYRLEAEVGI